MTDPDANLLRPGVVAERLAIEETTLAAWRCTKREALPFVRIGGAVRYRPQDVDQFIAKRLCAA